METNKERIAIPVDEGFLSAHFGHAGMFAIYDVEHNTVKNVQELIPPPHEPGSIPRWLHSLGVTTIITGGIGQKAIQYFTDFGIGVCSGAPVLPHDEIIKKYLANDIVFTGSTCNHDHGHGQSCHH